MRARSDGESMGTRYDTFITALEAVCERQEIGWGAPAHRSLRAFGKAVDLSRVPSMRRYRVAGSQFEPLRDALDSDSRLYEPVDLDEEELEGWEVVDSEVTALRAIRRGGERAVPVRRRRAGRSD